jgi:hypothetical protein
MEKYEFFKTKVFIVPYETCLQLCCMNENGSTDKG